MARGGGHPAIRGDNPLSGKDMMRKLQEDSPAGAVGVETAGIGRGPETQGWRKCGLGGVWTRGMKAF